MMICKRSDMSGDENLVARIRPIMSRMQCLTEKRMFGGHCFLINGNICVGTWKGSLVVRLGKEKHSETMTEPFTKPFDITGRTMKGWALVDPAGLQSEDDLTAWIRRSATFVKSLPTK